MAAWSSSSCDDEVEDDHGRRFVAFLCPSCGRRIQADSLQASNGGIEDLPGLPAGVKFDPTDQELLEHLEGKAGADLRKLHPLIDDFIPTIEGDNGICYTHPEKLPGVGMDGLIRHFFHRPSRAYTTGNRKRRKVKTGEEGSETRWHKTGKTRPIYDSRSKSLKGHKKILVLYANYGKQRKPEKTNWVMHQYHLGPDDEEKEGELVVSKIFYQTQPRHSGLTMPAKADARDIHININKAGNVVEVNYYNSSSHLILDFGSSCIRK